MTDKPNYSTAELVAWDREFVWHPFTPMKAWVENKDIVVIERGDGEWLIDTEGRRYIDGTSSIWCNVHGHAVPELDEAAREQLGKIAHTTLLGLASPPSILLAKKLVELMQARGMGLRKVFYSDDGSTAVEVACKLAYQYWRNHGSGVRGQGPERRRFLTLREAYHGDTIGAVSLGGIGMFHETFKGLCFAVDAVEPAVRGTGRHAPHETSTTEDVASVAEFAQRVERMFTERPGEYAAVVVEPVIQGAGGMIVQARGMLRVLRELCDRHEVLLIADEVMTGFGRTGRMFACEHEGVTPDLMCLSKGLTGGYMPLGATLCTRRVYEAFYADPREGKTFFHGHTFTGHPLACAVALRSIELMEEHGLVDRAQRLGGIMGEELRPLVGHPYVRRMDRIGLIGAVEVGAADGTRFPYTWRIGGALCAWMRRREAGVGVMLRPLADVLVLMPPLTIREENLRQMCRVVVESLRQMDAIIREKQIEFRG